jgi:hypothetical protein
VGEEQAEVSYTLESVNDMLEGCDSTAFLKLSDSKDRLQVDVWCYRSCDDTIDDPELPEMPERDEGPFRMATYYQNPELGESEEGLYRRIAGDLLGGSYAMLMALETLAKVDKHGAGTLGLLFLGWLCSGVREEIVLDRLGIVRDESGWYRVAIDLPLADTPSEAAA